MTITFENVSKCYKDKIILDNVSFEFKANQLYYLTGLNGVGKTTLFNMIMGYEKIDSGAIIISKESKKIQYMYQQPLIFSNLSIYENLLIKYLAHYEHDKTVDEYKNYFSLLLAPFELESRLETTVNQLSGGEVRKVILAQYLIEDPDVILLDEPTSNVDREQRNKFYQLIVELFPAALKIIITHDEINTQNGIILELSGGQLCQKIK